MRRKNELEGRLIEWGKEYGGGKYENIGWQGKSPIITLMTYHGRAPEGLGYHPNPSKAPADYVEEAVARLQVQRSGYRAAMVIRAEYMLPGQPVVSKLQKLCRIGVDLHGSRSRYSQLLTAARMFVAGHLGLAFDAIVDEYADEYSSIDL